MILSKTVLNCISSVINLNLTLMKNGSKETEQQASVTFFLNRERKESFDVSDRSKSPSRVVNGIRLYNFSDIDSYRRINRPILNEQKKKHIKEKLNLEKETQNKVNKRKKYHQEFVDYRYNPFDKKTTVGHSKSQMRFQPEQEEQKNVRKYDIVTAINNLKKKSLSRKKHSASLIRLNEHTEKFSKFVQKQVLQQRPSQLPRKHSVSCLQKKTIAGEQKSKYKPKAKNSVKRVDEVVFEGPDMDLDQILNIKEEKYDRFQYESFNIFKLLQDKNKYFEDNVPLQKYYFSFYNIVERFQKHHIDFVRDISRKSRSLVRKVPEEIMIDYGELKKDIRLEDLLGVAAGRYTPKYVAEQLQDKTSPLVYHKSKEKAINYAKGSKNQLANVALLQQEAAEIAEYKEICFTKDQIQYKKLCENRKEEINTLFKREQELVKSKIYDRQLHNQVKDTVEAKFKDFVEKDFRYPKTAQDRNHKVAVNKEEKKRNEAIKMKKLLQAFFEKKQNQEVLKDLKFKRT